MGAFDLADWLWPDVSQGRQPFPERSPSLDYSHSLLSKATGIDYWFGNNWLNSIILNNKPLVNYTPSLAASGFSRSGKTVRSTFLGNNAGVSNGILIPNGNYANGKPFTASLRLKIDSLTGSPYSSNIVGGDTSGEGLFAGWNSGTNIAIGLRTSGNFNTIWSVPLPATGAEFDLTFSVLPSVTSPYYGFQAFINGVDALTYGSASTNGGGTDAASLTLGRMCVGLDPSNYNNYYGGNVHLISALIVGGVNWTQQQTLQYIRDPFAIIKQTQLGWPGVSSGSTPTDVTALLTSTLTEGQQASISLSTDITSTPASTITTGQEASVTLSTLINAGLATTLIEGLQASIASPTNISAALASIFTSGLQSTITAPMVVSSFVGVSRTSGLPSNISAWSGLKNSKFIVRSSGKKFKVSSNGWRFKVHS